MTIYTKKQIETYLKRIGYTESINHKGNTLRNLQAAHLTHIPYENLDILNGIPLSLEPQDLFAKIITGHRGGYCFELNGLYSNLLKSLGFTVVNLAGRYIINGDGSIRMRRHRLLKVKAEDGEFLCDVGVRMESPRVALWFAQSEIQSDGISKYKLEKDEFYGWVLWQKESGKVWKKIYGFTEEPQLDIDYLMPSFYCETHPDSPFNQCMKLSIFTDTCNITLNDKILKFYESARVVKQTEMKSKIEIENALSEYFGIQMSSGQGNGQEKHLNNIII